MTAAGFSERELRRWHFNPRGNPETGAGFRPALLAASSPTRWPFLLAPRAGEVGEQLLPWSEHAWLHLLAHAAGAWLRPGRAAFREQVRAVLAEGRVLHGTGAVSESASLGALGARFLDPSALTRVLEHQHPAAGAGTEGFAVALAVLERFLAEAEPPVLRLVREERLELPEIEGSATAVAADPCAAAAELFDLEAARLAQVLRALRRVRLELAGEYESARHDLWLEQLDWQAFSPEELALLVPVVAVASADHVASGGMVALSRLLLSGRPVQGVVLIDPLAQPGAAAEGDPLAGYRFEPGFLALAHREALVSQTSAGEPTHMLQGFERALAATRAALHVVAIARVEAGEERAAAEVASRAHPLFRYDPQTGAHWAERLELRANPQIQADWPLHDFDVGNHQPHALAFTFADLALLEPTCAHHFHPLPDDVAVAELVPLAQWASAEPASPSGLPFLWAIDAGGQPRRLLVSRPLALACRDRLNFWRTLRELAGIDDELARRAAEAAREEAQTAARAERERLVAAHAQEIERLHRQAAEEVVRKLTAALLEVDALELVAPVEPGAVPAGPLTGFAGRSVEEVAAELLRLVDPATLDQASTGAGDGRAGQVAAELLRLAAEG